VIARWRPASPGHYVEVDTRCAHISESRPDLALPGPVARPPALQPDEHATPELQAAAAARIRLRGLREAAQALGVAAPDLLSLSIGEPVPMRVVALLERNLRGAT
jgi:hypothetical protein